MLVFELREKLYEITLKCIATIASYVKTYFAVA